MDAKNSVPPTVLEIAEQPPLSDAFATLEDFRITQPKAIGSVLRQLLKRKDFLTVQCGNRPHRILTRILEVNQDAGCFIYDGSAEALGNRSLLESELNYFSATQDGVRVQFVSGRPEQQAYDGAPAFRSALPQSLYRMQRREFFRIETPLADPYRCTAELPDKRQVILDIFDLSLIGVGLRSRDPFLGGLPIGTVLGKAVLDCRRMRIEVDLKITNLHNIRGYVDPIYHLGCHFENLPKTKEPDLQRLITYLELVRKGRRD